MFHIEGCPQQNQYHAKCWGARVISKCKIASNRDLHFPRLVSWRSRRNSVDGPSEAIPTSHASCRLAPSRSISTAISYVFGPTIPSHCGTPQSCLRHTIELVHGATILAI
jgi:hypothetical protein